MLKENDVKEIVNDKEYIIEVDLTLENFLEIILTDKYPVSLHTENIELIFHNSIEKEIENDNIDFLLSLESNRTYLFDKYYQQSHHHKPTRKE
ncbi:unnamed protein product [Rotaria sp. Silwood2]|nr:unnamed protein product [Rotaria sp. Silwood2]CAF4276303.1 unnamed protein product [Rotaria sp. Silwood2]